MNSKNYINGEWMQPDHGQRDVVSPANLEDTVGTLYYSDTEYVFQATAAANAAYKEWSQLSGAERGTYLTKMAQALEENGEEIATLGTRETGKPITEMRGEIKRGVQLLHYYASMGLEAEGSVIPSSHADVHQFTTKTPLGTVALIPPWNFPVAIPIWKMAPALLCGNTIVWKPADIASLTAVKLVKCLEGILPDGVLNLVIGRGRHVGNPLLEEANIHGVSFTGSTATGTRVSETCARRNIKCQTEMGGKNPSIVLKDANLDKTIPKLISASFSSAGQKCTATSRMIVEADIFDEVAERLKKEVAALEVGSPLDPSTYVGPVASEDQYKTVSEFAELARAEAEVVVEHEGETENGYYVHPMIVTGVPRTHSLMQDEIFGPVVVLYKVKDYEEATEVANDTEYGLSAAIFTENLAYAHRFLREAEAGMVRVNMETSGVEYQAPFGGMKMSSSYLREQGKAALDFYTQTKTCTIQF
ncbi:aldehyde dehydrogenase family protein [Bacillus piscicola]|uniref:aldehyde dehydrogenase family protein n=1 Tax=Bacillus piscicola TaxID=1632684 RepID=UPI001F09DC91|nr:aldehyde dehydrogenase family protein [Bacillus piscicola]